MTERETETSWEDRTRWDARWVGLLALLTRLGVVAWAWNRVPPTADGVFYDQVARRIAQGLGYTWLWPDGSVTFAAHYPVGYPAALGGAYALAGPHPGFGMLLNAAVGALGCWAMHGLLLESITLWIRPGVRDGVKLRRVAWAVGLFASLSPTLLLYTPALMTEGMVASLLALAARTALALRRRELVPWLGAIGLVSLCAAATLVRPQSILFAPVLGFAAQGGSIHAKRAWLLGAATFVATVLLCLPWTFRNCERMERCVFVSANGGWNLLIGTFEEGDGAWVPLEGERVPASCRDVFAEAAKDSCFKAAARRRIVADPLTWVSLAPAKWRATFDHTASATAHLAEAGVARAVPASFWRIGEVTAQRILYLAALFGAWTVRRSREAHGPRWGPWVLFTGIAGFMGLGAWIGWLCLVLLLLRRLPWTQDLGLALLLWGVCFTAAVHGVFFGAGRYSMPLVLWSAPLAAVGIAQLSILQSSSKGRKGIGRVELFDTSSGGER